MSNVFRSFSLLIGESLFIIHDLTDVVFRSMYTKYDTVSRLSDTVADYLTVMNSVSLGIE